MIMKEDIGKLNNQFEKSQKRIKKILANFAIILVMKQIFVDKLQKKFDEMHIEKNKRFDNIKQQKTEKLNEEVTKQLQSQLEHSKQRIQTQVMMSNEKTNGIMDH